MATAAGRRIVEMVWEDLKPSDFLTAASFDNAITTVLALGGSTNALVHLIAMARRAGIALTLDRFDELSRTTPLLANLRPAGKYLMEDFYYAGGLRALLAELGDLIDVERATVNGKTLGENIAGADVFNDDVIRRRDKPLLANGGLAVLRGNLAPDGAVIKPGAMEPHLLVAHAAALSCSTITTTWPRASTIPRSTSTPSSVLVLQQRRAARRARHARMGPAADSEEDPGAGRARHGAHFRCAHERHELRRVRAARCARKSPSAGRWRWFETGDDDRARCAERAR